MTGVPKLRKTKLIATIGPACDDLETMVDDELWPLPKYREMLFIH